MSAIQHTEISPVSSTQTRLASSTGRSNQDLNPQTQHLTGARIFLESLRAEGVDTVFGMPGGVILSVYEAWQDYEDIRHILVRHEQGGAHMAEGYAKSTGKPGVCMATSGPGATNLITALADAYYDSVPLVAFTGNVPSHLLGNDAFQEADIVGITRPITKHNIVVRRTADLAQAIKEAFHVATTGRPGPVLVDMPKDILLDTADFNYETTRIDLPGYQNVENFQHSDIQHVLELLKEAKRPVILAGGGVITADATQEIQQFAERFQIPVTSSLMGLGGFPAQHPLYLGFCGMHGHYWTNIAIAKADLLLVIGNRLGDRQTGNTSRFAKNAKIVHIDLDPTSLEKNVQTFLPIQGDIKNVVGQLLDASSDIIPSYADIMQTRPEWMSSIEGWKSRKQGSSEQVPGLMTPQFVIDRLFHWMPENAFVTTEVGQHQMWTAQRFDLSRPRSFVTSGGLGTMGFGFPAAIGIQAAFPDQLVLDIAGDGSFQMTLQELATARDAGLPVKVAIINNGYLGMVRQWQDKTWNRPSHSRMTSPDYVKLCEAYGAQGFVIESQDDVDRVIQEAYAIKDRPVIMDFRVREKSDVYPWVPAGGANDEMLLEETSTP